MSNTHLRNALIAAGIPDEYADAAVRVVEEQRRVDDVLADRLNDAGRRLGIRSRTTLFKLIADGDLHTVRVHGMHFVTRAEQDAFLERHAA